MCWYYILVRCRTSQPHMPPTGICNTANVKITSVQQVCCHHNCPQVPLQISSSHLELFIDFSFFFLIRNPHHDVLVQRGSRVWVHPVSPTDRALPLPWAVLWCGLHAGSIPPTSLWEALGAAPEHGCPWGPAPQGQGGPAGAAGCALPCTQCLKRDSWESMCNKVLLLYSESQKNTWRCIVGNVLMSL